MIRCFISVMIRMRKIYIVQCNDGTLYTGITNDLDRRIKEHNTSPKGALYTKRRRPVTLVWSCTTPSRSSAMREEYRIKKLTKQEKEKLIHSS
jgi:putative endonuclease